MFNHTTLFSMFKKTLVNIVDANIKCVYRKNI